MPRVRIDESRVISVKTGSRLLNVLRRKKIYLAAVCGGRGSCGSCRVRISGSVNPPCTSDRELITKKMLRQGDRLACQYRVMGDIGVETPGKVKTGAAKAKRNAGLVLDIGTTVIKGALVDLATTEVLKTTRIYNPQNEFGGDVMTRIGITLFGKYKTLRRSLMAGIQEVKNDLGASRPVFTAIAGNPVMTSFFLGRPVEKLARFPYKSGISKGIISKKRRLYVFGSIGGFVGGDTIAGILASGLLNNHGSSLYIDLGTNGEIALVSKKRILALSTAAGPAFEGAGLKCGSLAVPGAVDKIDYDGTLRVHTIGGRRPIGICASGLIDMLAVLLKMGWMNDRGQLLKRINIQSIAVIQEDVRKLQLAIGAIQTGIRVLLEKSRIKPHEVQETVITGEFGSSLKTSSLKRVGIIPETLSNVRFEKDLPLRGGAMVLTDRRLAHRAEKIRNLSRHVELALYPGFQKKFLKALRLASWN